MMRRTHLNIDMNFFTACKPACRTTLKAFVTLPIAVLNSAFSLCLTAVPLVAGGIVGATSGMTVGVMAGGMTAIDYRWVQLLVYSMTVKYPCPKEFSLTMLHAISWASVDIWGSYCDSLWHRSHASICTEHIRPYLIWLFDRWSGAICLILSTAWYMCFVTCYHMICYTCHLQVWLPQPECWTWSTSTTSWQDYSMLIPISSSPPSVELCIRFIMLYHSEFLPRTCGDGASHGI